MEIVSDVKFVKTCDQESANAIIKLQGKTSNAQSKHGKTSCTCIISAGELLVQNTENVAKCYVRQRKKTQMAMCENA